MIALLLARGADSALPNATGQTPLAVAPSEQAREPLRAALFRNAPFRYKVLPVRYLFPALTQVHANRYSTSLRPWAARC